MTLNNRIRKLETNRTIRMIVNLVEWGADPAQGEREYYEVESKQDIFLKQREDQLRDEFLTLAKEKWKERHGITPQHVVTLDFSKAGSLWKNL